MEVLSVVLVVHW